MANKFFYIHNGAIVGPLTIDAATGNLATSGTIYTSSTQAAISTATGALVVAGGVGIGGDLWVGGTINATIVGSVSTATNLAGGILGQIPYQTSPGITSFIGPGLSGQVLVSNGSAAPSYQSNLTLSLLTATTFTVSGSSILANLTATVLQQQVLTFLAMKQ
jgi:hypothetical protein